MAFGDLTQKIYNVTAEGGASTLTVTLDSTPTEGNLLVGLSHTRAASQSTPSGWFVGKSQDADTEDDNLTIYYKIAGSGESKSVIFDDSTSNQVILGIVLELEGPWNATPLDKTNGAYENSGSVTSDQPGTTGTLSQADEVMVVGFTHKFDVKLDNATNYSIDNSFTIDYDGETVWKGYLDTLSDAWRSQLTGAHKVVSAATAINPELSWITTANYTIAAIATFMKSSAAAEIIERRVLRPVMDHQAPIRQLNI